MRLILLLGLWFGLGGAFPAAQAPAPKHDNAFHQPASPSPAMESERASALRPAAGDSVVAGQWNAPRAFQVIRNFTIQRDVRVFRPPTERALDQRPPPHSSSI